jgi:hypothetical protein
MTTPGSFEEAILSSSEKEFKKLINIQEFGLFDLCDRAQLLHYSSYWKEHRTCDTDEEERASVTIPRGRRSTDATDILESKKRLQQCFRNQFQAKRMIH